jgi:hypothetical protein
MSKKQTVLKDFSQLQPVVEKRIELVAAGIYQIAFRGQALDNFQPKQGTQVHRIWKMTKLDERQQIAWQQFMDDVNLAHGKSGSVTSAYGEYADKGNGNEFKVPTAYVNKHYQNLEMLLDRFLSRRERALLAELTQDTLRGNSSMQIETVGLVMSGYADKASARAAGVAHCQALLSRLADFYGV